MTYFEGFVVPVPEANRDAYVKQASEFSPMFREFGVQRQVELNVSLAMPRQSILRHNLPQHPRHLSPMLRYTFWMTAGPK